MISRLQTGDLKRRGREFYNSLEAPAFDKFPVLQLYQEFLRENGALVALMSGSGSTTFAIAENLAAAETLAEKFKSQFGDERLDGDGGYLSLVGLRCCAALADQQVGRYACLSKLRQRECRSFPAPPGFCRSWRISQ